MNIQRSLGTFMVGMGIVLSGTAQSGGDPAAGALKAETCLGCHGIAGYATAHPNYEVPKLGGQHAEYLVAALQAYAAGQRSHPTMDGQSASLSEEDIADLAAYFSAGPSE